MGADADQDDLTLSLGGGTMLSLSPRVRLRADVRYFRAFVDESHREGGYLKDYGFLHAILGVTFAFGRS